MVLSEIRYTKKYKPVFYSLALYNLISVCIPGEDLIYLERRRVFEDIVGGLDYNHPDFEAILLNNIHESKYAKYASTLEINLESAVDDLMIDYELNSSFSSLLETSDIVRDIVYLYLKSIKLYGQKLNRLTETYTQMMINTLGINEINNTLLNSTSYTFYNHIEMCVKMWCKGEELSDEDNYVSNFIGT